MHLMMEARMRRMTSLSFSNWAKSFRVSFLEHVPPHKAQACRLNCTCHGFYGYGPWTHRMSSRFADH